MVTSRILGLPVSSLKFLVHVHYLVNSLGGLLVIWVVAIGFTEGFEGSSSSTYSLLAEFQNGEMPDSEQLKVLVPSIVQVHSDVLEVNFSVIKKHTDCFSFAKAIIVVKSRVTAFKASLAKSEFRVGVIESGSVYRH